MPPSQFAPLQRRIGTTLATYLLPRIATARVFSAGGGAQFLRDVETGWIAAARDAGVTRAPEAAWAQLHDAALLLALPAGTPTDGHGVGIARATQVVWDTDDAKLAALLQDIGVRAMTDRKEVQAVLRRRPEVWR